jgi:hypothetical protein
VLYSSGGKCGRNVFPRLEVVVEEIVGRLLCGHRALDSAGFVSFIGTWSQRFAIYRLDLGDIVTAFVPLQTVARYAT